MSHDIHIDFGAMISSQGEVPGTIALSDVYATEDPYNDVFKGFKAMREMGQLMFTHLPYDEKALQLCLEQVQKIPQNTKTIVVLGMGGSALGTRALATAWQKRTSCQRRLLVVDHLDPGSMSDLLQEDHITSSFFYVVSKSGTTLETLAQFLIVLEKLKKTHGELRYRDYLCIITDPAQGLLRMLSEEKNFPTLPIHPGVGGRFSVLTPVGLAPLAACGVPVTEILDGAARMELRCHNPSLWQNPAGILAILSYLAWKNLHRSINILMPYHEPLIDFGPWYVQLWAESLGKRKNLKGEDVRGGQTPLACMGVRDQHSQLQLFLEGPRDKMVQFLVVENEADAMRLANPFPGEKVLMCLDGKTLTELREIEWLATERALTECAVPSLTVFLPTLSANILGQLVMLYEIATAVMGGLMQVNPFDQPGVQRIKDYSLSLLDRKDITPWQEKVVRRQGQRNYIV